MLELSASMHGDNEPRVQFWQRFHELDDGAVQRAVRVCDDGKEPHLRPHA